MNDKPKRIFNEIAVFELYPLINSNEVGASHSLARCVRENANVCFPQPCHVQLQFITEINFHGDINLNGVPKRSYT